MTATNHMMTGAVIALGVRQPLLIVPLALASHFVLDMVPHFGVDEHDKSSRNKNPLFQYMLVLDIALALALLVFVPFVFHHSVNRWLLFISMLVAWIPDVIWVGHFFRHDMRGNFNPEHGWFARFHQKIQWFERPVGFVVEILFFGSLSLVIGHLLS